jgi:outer membrane usher protein
MGRYTGATVVLVDEAGRPLPVGTAVTVVATGEVQTVGYDGQVFLPDMTPVTRLRAQLDGGTCVVDIRFRSEDAMKTLGPFACERSP